MLFGILTAVVLFQILLYQWERRHKKSFMAVSLFGLWLLPMVNALQGGMSIFVAAWVLYTVVNVVVMRKTMAQTLDPKTPRFAPYPPYDAARMARLRLDYRERP